MFSLFESTNEKQVHDHDAFKDKDLSDTVEHLYFQRAMVKILSEMNKPNLAQDVKSQNIHGLVEQAIRKIDKTEERINSNLERDQQALVNKSYWYALKSSIRLSSVLSLVSAVMLISLEFIKAKENSERN
jgi:hypothetical protein